VSDLTWKQMIHCWVRKILSGRFLMVVGIMTCLLYSVYNGKIDPDDIIKMAGIIAAFYFSMKDRNGE